MITYDDFSKVDIRVGTIIAAEDFPEALTLGLPDANGNVVLMAPTHKVPHGGKLF